MARNVYEGMFILDSNRFSREADVLSRQIAETVRTAGGEMLVSRLWEDRRLAYPIKGHRKGAYWLTYFRLDPARLGEIHRAFQLNEAVLRFLFLKVDPRIVDTLVAHAQAGPAAPKAPEPAAKPPRGEDRALDDAAEEDDEAAETKTAASKSRA